MLTDSVHRSWNIRLRDVLLDLVQCLADSPLFDREGVGHEVPTGTSSFDAAFSHARLLIELAALRDRVAALEAASSSTAGHSLEQESSTTSTLDSGNFMWRVDDHAWFVLKRFLDPSSTTARDVCATREG